MNTTSTPLRVLVVEDEFIIADEIASIVEAAGHSVIGPIASVSEATAAVAGDRPDFAIIDASLRGQSSAPLASQLREMNVPFCVCTGYRVEDLRPTFGDARVVAKPVRASSIVAILGSVQRNEWQQHSRADRQM